MLIRSTATVNQNGGVGVTSLVTQSVAGNAATLNQTGDGADLYGQCFVPPSSTSTIDQSGDDNSVTVSQNTQTQLFSNDSIVSQSGDSNIASVDQFDDEQDSTINQTSNNNIASVTQDRKSVV